MERVASEEWQVARKRRWLARKKGNG
jgi:hypothetical protein